MYNKDNLMLDIAEEQTPKEGFKIEDDNKADWALIVIKKEMAELERLEAIIDDKIEDLKAKKEELKTQYNNKTAWMKGALNTYFETLLSNGQTKELKASWSYKLLSGSLFLKKESIEYKKDDEQLLLWLKDNNLSDYIKTKESVDWTAVKNMVKELDDEELQSVDGVERTIKPMSFSVK